MASRLSIENDRLKVGQVKRVTSNNGNKIDSITLLLNESVEVLFAPNGNTLEFTVSNPNIDMSNLDCTIDKETLTTQAFISKQIGRISDLANATLTPLVDVVSKKLNEMPKEDLDKFVEFAKNGNFREV